MGLFRFFGKKDTDAKEPQPLEDISQGKTENKGDIENAISGMNRVLEKINPGFADDKVKEDPNTALLMEINNWLDRNYTGKFSDYMEDKKKNNKTPEE